MDILIVSATTLELPMLAAFLQNDTNSRNARFDWLVTGVGQVATTYSLMGYLKNRKPDFVIQAGIAGSYSQDVAPGSVVAVSEEVLADLGAVEHGKLVSLFDLNLAVPDQDPFTDGVLLNVSGLSRSNPSLKRVRGATVNAISSSTDDAQKITSKYEAAIESMEGAALHYVCIKENIPFLQLRAISNFAGDRNKSNWKMKEAIEALHQELINMLSSINE